MLEEIGAPYELVRLQLGTDTKTPAYLKITRPGGTVCGTLNSADGGILRLTIAGAHAPVTIPLTTVTHLAVTPTCP